MEATVKMPDDEARRIFRNRKIKIDEALSQMPGWSRKAAYEAFGSRWGKLYNRRGRPAAPKRKRDQANEGMDLDYWSKQSRGSEKLIEAYRRAGVVEHTVTEAGTKSPRPFLRAETIVPRAAAINDL